LNATAVVPVRPLPLIVTFVPAGPLVGLKDVIVGGLPPEIVTVKLVELVPVPTGFVTVIGPLVAPLGTTAASCVSPTTWNDAAAVPLNATAVVPKKPLPVIDTFVPAGPLVGLKDVIVGALTVKFVAEVVLPTVFVIVMGPLVAPL
jgi:hypothetical protein